MLRFHILDVGQGDSIIVEHVSNEKASFGVIDSNGRSGAQPRALEKLQELGAEYLSFVCLTHPHRDHYRGLGHILKEYEGKIDQVLMFPAGEFIGAKVGKLAKTYKKIADETDDQSIAQDVYEFVRILKWIDQNIGLKNVPEYTGPYNLVPVKGFEGVEIFCILPWALMKGAYLDRIRAGDASIIESQHENDLSIALVFRYRGICVTLGGDATHANWQRFLFKQHSSSLPSIHSAAAKLPHHGSKHDCTDDTLNVIFGNNDAGERCALVSANGVKHPDELVLRKLEERGIKPYCTNLHSACGNNLIQIRNMTGLDPVLGNYLNSLASETPPQPCQGDISFTIHNDGSHKTETQLNVPCDFRGDYEKLFGM